MFQCSCVNQVLLLQGQSPVLILELRERLFLQIRLVRNAMQHKLQGQRQLRHAGQSCVARHRLIHSLQQKLIWLQLGSKILIKVMILRYRMITVLMFTTP